MTALYDEFSDPREPDSLTIAFDQLEELPPAYAALSGARGGEIVGPLEYDAGKWEVARYVCAGVGAFGLLMTMFPKGR